MGNSLTDLWSIILPLHATSALTRRLMSTARIASLLAALFFLSVYASEVDVVEEAKARTFTWLALVDSGRYETSWESAASLFQVAISKEDWVRTINAVRSPLGEVQTRELASAKFTTTLPGAPDGEYVLFQIDSSFERKASAVETVTALRDTDGVWKVSGYFIK